MLRTTRADTETKQVVIVLMWIVEITSGATDRADWDSQ